ncbi:MAG: hypothetical protein NVSMB26_18200 [Beijerinckiaceae bacterium]
MRIIGSNAPRTALGAIGSDLRASYPPETAPSAEITRLLQRLCAVAPSAAPMSESRQDGKSRCVAGR